MDCENCGEPIDADTPCPKCGWWFCPHEKAVQTGPDDYECERCGVDL